jgi:stage V sporulation protein G
VEITEVRIKLMEGSEDRLRAFCSITFDHCFVIRDLKIIDGVNGPFVAMPSRKLTGHCQRCSHKNHLRAQYCNQCGAKLRSTHDSSDDSPQKLYADVAHPINSVCREMIQSAVIEELEEELARAGEPGYRSRYDDEFDAVDAGPEVDLPVAQNKPIPSPKAPPPKPHFDRHSGSKAVSPQDHEEDDLFGSGIF